METPAAPAGAPATSAPVFPIVVGVVGHRDLLPGCEPALREAVRGVLTGLRAKSRFGAALYLMTSLADGADQLAADVAEALDEALDEDGRRAPPIGLIAVSPMPLADYRARLADVDRFDRHWARAALRIELPEPCETPADLGLRFEQLGVMISRRSHLLLALWDGMAPGFRSDEVRRGGAAAVARMRCEGEAALPGFRHSLLFPDGVSRLDLARGGPVVQIVTPRGKTEGAVAPKEAAAGAVFVLPEREEIEDARPGDTRQKSAPPEAALPKRVAPDAVFEALGETARRDFGQILDLNRRIASYRGYDAKLFDRHVTYLIVKDLADPPGEAGQHLARLRRWQAAADAAAQFYQRRLMGELTPAKSPVDMFMKAKDILRDAGRPPHPGIVFVYAALVPVAAVLFETYVHLTRAPVALFLYLAVFAGGAAYFQFRVHRHALQNRFQDYRALAEALRVQLFWAAAATPEAAADSYLRKQSGELGWIQFAMRGPALWATAAALTLREPRRGYVTLGWIDDQIKFFDRKSRLNAGAARRAQAWAKGFLMVGLAVAVSLALVEAARMIPPASGLAPPAHGLELIERLREPLIMLAVCTPALAAFFTLWVELRAYEAQADSYALMGRIFQRAKDATDPEQDDEAFKDVVRDLGREALAENAEWLVDHRRRKIEQKT